MASWEHHRILSMIAQGWDDDRIVDALVPRREDYDKRVTIRQRVAILRQEREARTPMRRTGPWPIHYTRDDGERVFLVCPGHAIGERSLKAFGFFLPAGA